MARRGDSKPGHVVRALADCTECKSRRILVLPGKEACVGHRGVDLEHQSIVWTQSPCVIEIGKRSDRVSPKDAKPTTNVPSGREIRIECNRLFDQRETASDVLTQR